MRERIWARLRDVALPDTRFHLNFAEVHLDIYRGFLLMEPGMVPDCPQRSAGGRDAAAL